MQLDEHGQLEGARHRKRLIAVDRRASTLLSRCLTATPTMPCAERHGGVDAAAQPIEIRRRRGLPGRQRDDEGKQERQVLRAIASA